MRVCLGSMLGKGGIVGRIAALMVGLAQVVPLGINHDLRRVGGLCAPVHQLTQDLKIGAGGGPTVELPLPEHCCCYGSKPRCFWGACRVVSFQSDKGEDAQA